MIIIVDYGSGNLKALANIYSRLNIQCMISGNDRDILNADKVILPGVGAFDETILKLEGSGIRQALEIVAHRKKIPVLGICVGMQILSNSSDEGELNGMGWLDGQVKLIDKSLIPGKPKIPHLGWNSVKVSKDFQLFDGIDSEKGFYFLHSYYFECNDERDVLCTTYYGKEFVSGISRNNIYGVQFHPEKSHQNGVRLLKNFATL